MYTTHEKIRVRAGLQARYDSVSFGNTPNGSITEFFLRTDNRTKIVPEFSTGNTVAGVSDVQVYLGLSGIAGMSRMNISSVNVEKGSVTLDTAPASGSSLVVNYSSSAIPDYEVSQKLTQAEAILNGRLSLCYDMPFTTESYTINELATELAAAFLLMRSYGVGSQNTAEDGYALYARLMGDNEIPDNFRDSNALRSVGEIGLICSLNYQITDNAGNVIPRNDTSTVAGSGEFEIGGRNNGRLFDITDEPVRKKDYQSVVNRNQPGSGL